MTKQQFSSSNTTPSVAERFQDVSGSQSTMNAKQEELLDEEGLSDSSDLTEHEADDSYTDDQSDGSDNDTKTEIHMSVTHAEGVETTQTEGVVEARAKPKKSEKQLRAEIAKKNEKLNKAQRLKRKYKRQFQRSQNDLRACKRKLNESDADRCRMRDEIFQNVEEARNFFESDELVTQSFDALFEEVDDWTKSHAAFCEGPTRADFQTAVNNLCDDKLFPGFASFEMRTAMETGRVHPRIIVTAYINQFLALNIFENPFGFLKNRTDGGRDMDTIKWMISLAGMKGSNSDAIKARVSCMKLVILTDGGAPTQQVKEHLGEMDGVRREYSLDCADLIIRDIGMLLKPVDRPKQMTRRQSLTHIICESAHLSCRLAAQHSDISLDFLGKMKRLKFKVDHDKFVCHRARKIEEDDSQLQAALSKKSLDMVVQPLVVRSGATDSRGYGGRGYGKGSTRIISKAVVWMVKSEIPPGKGPDDHNLAQENEAI